MARLRYNGLATTLGAALALGDTTITFAAALTHSGGTAVPTITGSDYIPLTILTGSGAVSEIVYLTAYTTAGTTGTITRGQEGTSGVAHSLGDGVIHGPTVADLGSGASSVLAVTAYMPATSYTKTATSTTPVDVDATNLAVSFTAPSSGKVLVTLSAFFHSGTGDSQWWLREGSTNLQGKVVKGAAVTFAEHQALFYIAGLTPGSSHTYKWAWASTNGSTIDLYAGGSTGLPAIMKVEAAP